MAGFLDSKERVIDMVLTETGKQLLMKGELRFVYWIPFDDEVDYAPPVTSLDAGHENQTLAERKAELIETPLVREATMGYRGLNLVSEDLTNLHRPMFTAVPGVGLTSPLPQAVVDTGSLTIQISQQKISKVYLKSGIRVGPVLVGFQRSNSSAAPIHASYSTGSFTSDAQFEGFLLTMYQSSSLVTSSIGTGTLRDVYSLKGQGGHEEVLHNRDSTGNIVYHNNLTLVINTP